VTPVPTMKMSGCPPRAGSWEKSSSQSFTDSKSMKKVGGRWRDHDRWAIPFEDLAHREASCARALIQDPMPVTRAPSPRLGRRRPLSIRPSAEVS
jgi:hypothetical protein